MDTKANERVKVIVRCRPMNLKEIDAGFSNIINVIPSVNSIQIFNPTEKDTEGKTFTFDAVYSCNSTQEQLYNESVQPVINSVLDGFNGTIFAYGQTGTGKTYTMEGSSLDVSQTGVIPKALQQIFDHISQSKNMQYLVRASYIEIYQEEIKDLLDDSGEKYHELAGDGSGIYIKNLRSHLCKSVKEMADVMKHGKRNRKVGATDMNQYSSRSHAIFIITIEMSKTISGVNHVKVGKLNLVDLAGSERQTKTCASGKRLKEASKINLSLSALGNVISALSNGKNFHVPYRDSKLTRLLQDSLGGNSKTLMIANIGPASYNYSESLTTLRYAHRAKNIKNKPIINEDPKDTLIRQYQDEIKRLKALVESKREIHSKSKVVHDKITDTKYTGEVNKHILINNESDKCHLISTPQSLPDKEKIKRMQKETEQSLILETAQNIDTLEKRIYSMESRILQGVDIIEHTNKQQEVLQQKAEEIKERKRYNMELEQQLEKEEETTEELHDSRMTLQQEIERKTKKLFKLYNKLKIIKSLTADAAEEFNNDRNNLQLSQNELIKEYKLNQIIIDNFISSNDKNAFMTNVYYDELCEKWKTHLNTNLVGERSFARHYQRRPESEYSRILAKLNYSARFKGENILNFEIEHFKQTSNQYKTPEISPSVKCALQNALKTEDDITVDASSSKGTNLLNQESKSSSQLFNNEFLNRKIYPKVRGLVKRK